MPARPSTGSGSSQSSPSRPSPHKKRTRPNSTTKCLSCEATWAAGSTPRRPPLLENSPMPLPNSDPFAAVPPLPHEPLRAVAARGRARYLTLGYEPIPIVSGRKRPATSGWQNIEITLPSVAPWAETYPGALSTGIRTKSTPGFDIDIRDADMGGSSAASAAQHAAGRHDPQAHRLATEAVDPMSVHGTVQQGQGRVQVTRRGDPQGRGAGRRPAIRGRGHSRRHALALPLGRQHRLALDCARASAVGEQRAGGTFHRRGQHDHGASWLDQGRSPRPPQAGQDER